MYELRKIIGKCVPYLFLLWFLFVLYVGITRTEIRLGISLPYIVYDAIYISLSLISGFLALNHYRRATHLLRIGVKTTAEVIQLIRSSTGMGDTFSPLFEYYDQSHTKRTFSAGWGSSSPDYEIGDKVRVVYNPYNFEAKICTFWILYRGMIFFVLLAFYLLLIALV